MLHAAFLPPSRKWLTKQPMRGGSPSRGNSYALRIRALTYLPVPLVTNPLRSHYQASLVAGC